MKLEDRNCYDGMSKKLIEPKLLIYLGKIIIDRHLFLNLCDLKKVYLMVDADAEYMRDQK